MMSVHHSLMAFFAFGLLTILASSVQAATFNVTSGQACSGTASLADAIAAANTTPGPDTIEINVPVLTDDCTVSPTPDEAIFEITESVTINGNGAYFVGKNAFISESGVINPFDTDCPTNSAEPFVYVGFSDSLFQIGERDTPNPGVDVTINELYVRQVPQLAAVRDGASLTLNDTEAEDIWDISACSRPMIQAFGSADLTLTDFTSNRTQSYATLPNAAILGGTGTLVMRNSQMTLNANQSAISWEGDGDVVSSLFSDAGGISKPGPGTLAVVNSLIYVPNFPDSRFSDHMRVFNNGTLSFEAATLFYEVVECKPISGPQGVDTTCLYDGSEPDAALWVSSGGTLNLVETAVHAYAVDASVMPSQSPFLANLGGTITADAASYVRPLPQQDAAALEVLTGQAGLITALDALPTSSVTPVGVTDSFPAVVTPIETGGAPLVDLIPDAGSGGANELVDPDGSPITLDILGNTRTDSDRRSVGAVQNNVIPDPVAPVTGVTYEPVTVRPGGNIRLAPMGTGWLTSPTFLITSGTLPPGLMLDPTTGVISGRATACGSSFGVLALDTSSGALSTTVVRISCGDPVPVPVMGIPALALLILALLGLVGNRLSARRIN